MNIIIGEKLIVFDKSNVIIVCKVEGIFLFILFWSKDGFRLLENLQFSVLYFIWVILEDVGWYICIVENYLGFDSQLVDFFVIGEYILKQCKVNLKKCFVVVSIYGKYKGIL